MLKNKLEKDQIAALKSGAKPKLNFLRYILAQIKNAEIDKQEELSDEETIEVLQKIKKELQEALDSAEKGKRDDLISEYKMQLGTVTSYLPQE